MAQLDVAVDVRQAINHGSGKNLIGAMYAPKAVIIDPSLLATLPLRHLRSGLAEAIKHALTQSRLFWRYLREHAAQIRHQDFLRYVVRETIRRKLALLTRPAADGGEFLLQYGHCIGHAIETATCYRYSHGEAIAIGMTVSAEIGVDLGVSAPALVDEHRAIFRAYGLPSRLGRGADVDAVVALTLKDKYVASKTPRMAVLRRVGCAYQSAGGPFVAVPPSVLRRHLLANRVTARRTEEPCRS
jgi:3-dehydroquinate synthase